MPEKLKNELGEDRYNSALNYWDDPSSMDPNEINSELKDTIDKLENAVAWKQILGNLELSLRYRINETIMITDNNMSSFVTAKSNRLRTGPAGH